MVVSVTSSVFAPATAEDSADPYDLTTLVNAHLEIKVPVTDETNDTWLSRAITQASRSIATYCDRVFPIEGLTDQFDIQQDPYPWQTPGGVNPLQLSRFPVAQVAIINLATAVAAGATILPLVSAPPSWVVAGTPVSGTNLSALMTNSASVPLVTVASLSGNNVTISTPVAEELPAGTPICLGLSVFQQIAINTWTAFVLGTDFKLDYDPNSKNNIGQLFRIDEFTGVVTNWEALPVSVSYYAGYSEIPPDLEDAALRLITMRYFGWGRDPALKAQEQPGSLGRREWWIGGPPKSGGLPEEVTGLIDKFRTPVIG